MNASNPIEMFANVTSLIIKKINTYMFITSMDMTSQILKRLFPYRLLSQKITYALQSDK